MPSIHHQVGIKAPQKDVYKALCTREGLAHWWTRDTRGSCSPGKHIEFHFDGAVIEMQVLAAEPEQRVRWKCTGGHPEWLDTEIEFRLRTDDHQTKVDFSHEEWRETTELLAHCSTKWAVFLLSLKDYLEMGKGHPFPNDVQVNHSE